MAKVENNRQNILKRQFSGLKYFNPYKHLIELRKIELHISQAEIPKNVKNLRTNKLKFYREMRDAAIFCVGMSEYLGTSIYFAPHENSDYDFVATYQDEGSNLYVRAQLKELVSEELNPDASIEQIISGLSRYADASDICVAIKISRKMKWDPKTLVLPLHLSVGSLWVFSSISEDQSEFAIWGDFAKREPINQGVRFNYPNNITR